MERFAVKTPDMAHKTLWMMMISYDLMRGFKQESAIKAGKPLAHVNFKGILGHVTASHESFIVHRGKPRCQAGHRNGLIETCATKLLVVLPNRTEPRAIKRRPKKFHYSPHPVENTWRFLIVENNPEPLNYVAFHTDPISRVPSHPDGGHLRGGGWRWVRAQG
jgi:hypothetical protein